MRTSPGPTGGHLGRAGPQARIGSRLVGGSAPPGVSWLPSHAHEASAHEASA